MYKDSCPFLYCDSLYTDGQDCLNIQYNISDDDGISDDVDLAEDDVEQRQGRADESDGQAASVFSLGKHPKLTTYGGGVGCYQWWQIS